MLCCIHINSPRLNTYEGENTKIDNIIANKPPSIVKYHVVTRRRGSHKMAPATNLYHVLYNSHGAKIMCPIVIINNEVIAPRVVR